MEIILRPYQEHFIDSQKRFPCLISGIGTGKTFMMLLKVVRSCMAYPNSLWYVVRKEFTDLQDSTMEDFKKYFPALCINSNRDCVFDNGSKIMFRHAGEANILKNLNLDGAAIEQGEEFDTDEAFELLRDRLRGTHGPVLHDENRQPVINPATGKEEHTQQLIIIANAKGHNWMWRNWINNPSSVEFDCVTATTYENEINLPMAFMADIRSREKSAHNHYMQMVMNSFEEVDSDDLLLSHKSVYASPTIEIMQTMFSRKRVMGIDVARFGDDETVFTIIEQKNVYQWEQIYLEGFHQKDTVWTSGFAIELQKKFGLELIVVDDVGVGGGVTDSLRSNRSPVISFIGNAKAVKKDRYANADAEGFFTLQEFFNFGWFKMVNDMTTMSQLLSLKFRYKSLDIKAMITKDEMRKAGLKSPDRAKALMMAIWGHDKKSDVEGGGGAFQRYGVGDDNLMEAYRGGNRLQAYGINN
jgi:phage terminase large subunit